MVGVVTMPGPWTTRPGSSAVSSNTGVSTESSTPTKWQRRDAIGLARLASPAGSEASNSTVSPSTYDATRVVVKELREQYSFEPQLIEGFVRGAAILRDHRHPCRYAEP